MRYLLFLFTVLTATTISCNNNNTKETATTDTTAQVPLDTAKIPVNNLIPIKQVLGDLNGDGLEDKVTVEQDTLVDSTWPYTLKVFLKQANGQYNQTAETKGLIDPQYLDGKNGYKNGNQLGDITIENGVLVVSNQQLRGHDDYKFRYQHGSFELIGFYSIGASGGTIEEVDYNLSTGTRLYKQTNQETDKTIKDEKEKKKISPLPVLDGFSVDAHVEDLRL